MDITPEVWETVTGLKCEGLNLGKGTIEGLEEYNKITFYRSCLRNSQVAGKDSRLAALMFIQGFWHSSSFGFSLQGDTIMLCYMKKISF